MKIELILCFYEKDMWAIKNCYNVTILRGPEIGVQHARKNRINMAVIILFIDIQLQELSLMKAVCAF